MKYKFSILAPHPDDEFIGCYRFFKTHGNAIDNVIFVTNGERSVTSIPDMLERIKTRRFESLRWIQDNTNNAQVHFLNLPDGIDFKEFSRLYGGEIFEELHGQKMYEYTLHKINTIIGDNILLVCNMEKHPSHMLTGTFGELIPQKCIYYSIHQQLLNKIEEEGGLYYKRVNLMDTKLFSYWYIHSDPEVRQKRAEFQQYFPSQYEDFARTGLTIKNWESYLSPIPLKLDSEDNTHLIRKKMRFI